MFSAAKDEWATPQELFDQLNAEFHFGLDAAASPDNAKCDRYLTDAIGRDWGALSVNGRPVWLNPPYSRVGEFIKKASLEAEFNGATVVCLVYARTDTRWFHEHVYDAATNRYRPDVEVRFIKGRVKFGGAKAGAPAPSMVVIFRPRKPS